MDVLIDTNALVEGGVGGIAFKALRSYLKRTNSALLIPAVVQEEMIAKREREVREIEATLATSFKKLKRYLPSFKKDPPAVNVAESTALLRHQLAGVADQVVFVENEAADMKEMVRRLANRIAPASKDGEEARDVLIWLALLPKAQSGRIAFISNDKGFYSKDKLKLELIADLGQHCGNLETFRRVDDFLKKYATRSSFVTEQWLKTELESNVQAPFLLRALEELYHEDESNPLGLDISSLGEETQYTDVLQVLNLEVTEFFVTDADPNELYVSATLLCELEVEVEFFPWTGSCNWPVDRDNPKCDTMYPEVEIHVQLDVTDEFINSIRVSSMTRA